MESKREKEGKPRKSKGLEDLFGHYELCNQAEGKSLDTTDWYRYIFNQFTTFLKNHHHSLTLSSFNIDMGRAYVLYLRQRPRFQGHPYTTKQGIISTETVRGHVRGLRAFSSWLYEEGYTRENKLKNLKPPKAPLKYKEPLSPEEIDTAACCVKQNKFTGIRDHVIYMMALDNGLRASELADIELARLNLKEGHVRVMGKGSKERIVPIGEYVRNLILYYISQVRPQPADHGCDKLFLSPKGKPITTNTIKLMFSRLAKKSGINRLHAHLCRYTFAVNYLLNGGDIYALQEILGHTTLEMVRHYLHFTSSQILAQHHKYSPIDKLYGKGKEK